MALDFGLEAKIQAIIADHAGELARNRLGELLRPVPPAHKRIAGTPFVGCNVCSTLYSKEPTGCTRPGCPGHRQDSGWNYPFMFGATVT